MVKIPTTAKGRRKVHSIFPHRGIKRGVKFLTKAEYGLRSLESGLMTPKQIEGLRKILSKNLKKIKNVIIIMRIQPIFAKTQKPLQVRMVKEKETPIHSLR